jgi:hypothetical protein
MRETTRAAGLVLLLLALLAARIPAAEPPASPRSEVPDDASAGHGAGGETAASLGPLSRRPIAVPRTQNR